MELHHYFGPSNLTDSTDDLAAERAKAERHDIAFVDLGGVQWSRTALVPRSIWVQATIYQSLLFDHKTTFLAKQ